MNDLNVPRLADRALSQPVRRGCLLPVALFALLALAVTYARISRIRQISALLGGAEVVEVISSAEQVEVFQTVGFGWFETNASSPPPLDLMDKAGQGTRLPKREANRITKMLLSPRSYRQATRTQRGGVFFPEVVLSFTNGTNEVEFVICVESGSALLKAEGGLQKTLDIDPIRNDLARAIKPFLSRQPANWPPF